MFLSERESELASVKSTLSHAEQTLEQQRTLIARLEEDIARGLSNSGVTSAQASADDIGALLQTQSTDRTATSGADLGAMLKIISNQRDRFKTLVTQLEGVRIALEAALAYSYTHRLRLHRAYRMWPSCRSNWRSNGDRLHRSNLTT